MLDNLIAQGEIPATHRGLRHSGHRADPYPDDLGMKNPDNRAAEYDALTDAYARFVVDELLPEVGKSYNLTDRSRAPRHRRHRSGAICAFTVAWHRPDAVPATSSA